MQSEKEKPFLKWFLNDNLRLFLQILPRCYNLKNGWHWTFFLNFRLDFQTSIYMRRYNITLMAFLPMRFNGKKAFSVMLNRPFHMLVQSWGSMSNLKIQSSFFIGFLGKLRSNLKKWKHYHKVSSRQKINISSTYLIIAKNCWWYNSLRWMHLAFKAFKIWN